MAVVPGFGQYQISKTEANLEYLKDLGTELKEKVFNLY